MTKEEKAIKEVTCKHCGWTWETKSRLHKATCPSCQNKVEIKERKQ